MGRSALILLFLGLLFLVSCDKNRIYDEYETLPNQWHKDSIVDFQLTAPDTLNDYNLFINLRNNSDYRYSNLFLITEIHFPKGKVISDTLQYQMTEPSGEWLGTGFGDIKENKFWYKENFRFTEDGDYVVTVQQAMRKRDSVMGIENLEGITEVGFRIEDINN